MAFLQAPKSTAHTNLPQPPPQVPIHHLSVRVHDSWKTDLTPLLHIETQTTAVASLFKPRKQSRDSAPQQRLVHTPQQFDIHNILATRQVWGTTEYKVEWKPEYITAHQIAASEKQGFVVESKEQTEEIAYVPQDHTRKQRSRRQRKTWRCDQCHELVPQEEIRSCATKGCQENVAHTDTECSSCGWQCSSCRTENHPDDYWIHKVLWAPAWQLKEAVIATPTGPLLLARKRRIRGTRTDSPPLPAGWFPKNLTLTWNPINPDLDMPGDGHFHITTHPTNTRLYTLVNPGGSAVTTLNTGLVQHLWKNFRPSLTARSFEEEVHRAVTRIGTRTSQIGAISKTEIWKNRWGLNASLDKAIIQAFHITRTLFSDSLNQSQHTDLFHSLYEEDRVFSGLPPNQLYEWEGASQANPEYDHTCMKTALEHAIVSCHSLQAKQKASLTILVLPHWKHTTYMDRHLRQSPYVQLLTNIPSNHNTFQPPDTFTGQVFRSGKGTKWETSLYLVANHAALEGLDIPEARQILRTELIRTFGAVEAPSVNQIRKHALSVYEEYHPHNEGIYYQIPSLTPPVIQDRETTGRYSPSDHIRKYDPDEYIYTDGSKTKSAVLGAAVYYPIDNTTLTIQVLADPIRNTINRAELAAIAEAVNQAKNIQHLKILTDSACSIQTINIHIRRPHEHLDHIHRDLLSYVDTLVRERDEAGLI